MSARMLIGDCLDKLRELPAESVHCCVTSPPYYGLRDYGTATWEGGDPECDHSTARRGHGAEKQSTSRGTSRDSLAGLTECRRCGATRQDNQIGLEPTPEEHIAKLVEVFREVRRVLRKDGVLWLNYGDAYATTVNGRSAADTMKAYADDPRENHPWKKGIDGSDKPYSTVGNGYKAKDLLMMPARVALALQQDGWWLRSMMPWVKRSAMPESVTDRPATAIEYVFLLAKSGETTFWQHRDGGATRTKPAPDYRWVEKCSGDEIEATPPDHLKKEFNRINLWRGRDYFFDMEAVRQAHAVGHIQNHFSPVKKDTQQRQLEKQGYHDFVNPAGRNFRNADLFYASLAPPHGLICGDEPLALDVNPAAFSESHFATFPPKLVEPLIKAATSEKGVCAECGAPWVREVETEQQILSETGTRGGRGLDNAGWSIAGGPRTRRVDKTTGWSPSCACGVETTPATVLDPFGGAGTVGLVADRLKRNSILIELNPEYADMARRRISGDAPLFAEVSA